MAGRCAGDVGIMTPLSYDIFVEKAVLSSHVQLAIATLLLVIGLAVFAWWMRQAP